MVYQIPILLVCLIGFIMGMVWYRRAPKAAVLTIVGTGLIVLTAVILIVVQVSLMNLRTSGSSTLSVQTYASISYWVNLGGNVLRSIATALIIAAVFVGRKAEAMVGFPVAQAVPPIPQRY